jgi:ADP-ribosylglycohydrolase
MNIENSMLFSKVKGCLYGGAVGDAMGGPAEWHSPEEIKARYGEITDLVENWDGPTEIGKGDGRYTDDSHMVQLLSQTLIDHGDHLDAFAFLNRMVPKMAYEKRWVPERGREMPLVERLFYPEKWLYMRFLANADPRQAGVGNMVNCGAAMYAAPIGIVNACDPANAYREGIEVFSAHQHSYGLEAAAVMAACVAEAFKPTASVDSVVEVALSFAKDGTQKAIAAVVDCAQNLEDWRTAIKPLRDVMRQYDGSAEDGKGNRGNGTNNWTASRQHSIEELPIALGFLVVAQGDFEQTIFGATNYGRDNDSIAGMGGAIAGALGGFNVIRSNWVEQINSANRIDLHPLAIELTELTHQLQRAQFLAAQDRNQMFAEMLEGS